MTLDFPAVPLYNSVSVNISSKSLDIVRRVDLKANNLEIVWLNSDELEMLHDLEKHSAALKRVQNVLSITRAFHFY